MVVQTSDLPPNDSVGPRSARLRKLSQKAKEIAEAIQPATPTTPTSVKSVKAVRSAGKSKSASKPKKKKSSSAATAKVKAGGKRGRAIVDEDGDVQIEEVDSQQHVAEPEEDDDALYCICLGHDDHTPMIQCEECENWFHFACIQLDPSEASIIQAFYCDVCEASGSGKTHKIEEAMIENEDTEVSGSAEPISSIIDVTDHEETVNDVGIQDDTETKIDPSLSSTSIHEPRSIVSDSSLLASDNKLCDGASQTTTRGDLGEETLHASQPPSQARVSRRKHRRAEGLTSDEGDSDGDEDFTGEEIKKSSRKKRKFPAGSDNRRHSQARLTSTTPCHTAPHTPESASTPHATFDKTRAACIEQFLKLFEPAFLAKVREDAADAADAETEKKQSEVDATRFAELVESELFESFGELDTNNIKVPRKNYMAKFRSLFFNLKHNAAFLNSLSPAKTSASSIVHMTNQDLQTPEQKAISEQIRQRALHDSVRNVILAPKVKMTHKGEQTIESFDTHDIQHANISGARPELPLPLSRHHTGGSESFDVSETSALPTPTFGPGQSVTPGPTPESRSSSFLHVINPEPQSINHASTDAKNITPSHDTNLCPAETSEPIVAINTFDLERVFAAMSAVPSSAADQHKRSSTEPDQGTQKPEDNPADDGEAPSEDNMDLAATPDYEAEGDRQAEVKKGQLPDDYDPFVVAHGGDADLDAILYGDQSSSTTPPHSPAIALPPPVVEVSEPLSLPVLSLPVTPMVGTPVWKGNVMTADAGGFAACAFQVGGRPLCTASSTWDGLFPTDTLTVVGRLPVKDSTNYLVQSHFAASRELVVLDLFPNLDGPPDLPNPERVLHHQQNLIDFFTKKGRHAVVTVHDKAKHIVRDIYLVPLLKDEQLPEFIQLLDDVAISEVTPRPRDMILAILVLQKGAVPTGWRPPPVSPDADLHPASAQFQASSAPIASRYQPPPTSITPASQHVPHLPMLTKLALPQASAVPLPTDHAAIPILQSLSSALSATPQLPFNLFPPIPPTTASTPSTGMGPPPGFVPYVPPPSSTPLPPAASPANLIDFSNVDVNALKALLSNPQVFKPSLDAASHMTPTQGYPTDTPASSSRLQPCNSYASPTVPSPNRPNDITLGSNSYANFQNRRPVGLPPIPKMSIPWPDQKEVVGFDHRNRNPRGARMSEPMRAPYVERPNSDPPHRMQEPERGRAPRIHESRLQEIRMQDPGWNCSSDRHRSDQPCELPASVPRRRSQGAGPAFSPGPMKRPGPHEFVAPTRDDGWAGRGGSRMGGRSARSVSDQQQHHHHQSNTFQRDQDMGQEDPYSAPIWMGR